MINSRIYGDTIVAGAELADPDGAASAGAAYIFTRSGNTWTQQVKIQGSDTDSADRFGGASSFGGFGTAISGDTVIVGASGKNAAYILVAS